MLRWRVSSVFLLIFAFAGLAFAADSQGEGSSPGLTEAALNFLPFAVLMLLLYLFIWRQTKSPLAKLQKKYMEDNIQHMRRVEESLERIAKALEERNRS